MLQKINTLMRKLLKLNFKSHILEAILNAWRGIGCFKHLGVILDSKLNFKKSYSRGYLESTERNWFVKIPFKICIKRGP